MCPICPCFLGDTVHKSLCFKWLRDVTQGDPDMAFSRAFGDAIRPVGMVAFGSGVAVSQDERRIRLPRHPTARPHCSWNLDPDGAAHLAFGEHALGCATSLTSTPSRRTG